MRRRRVCVCAVRKKLVDQSAGYKNYWEIYTREERERGLPRNEARISASFLYTLAICGQESDDDVRRANSSTSETVKRAVSGERGGGGIYLEGRNVLERPS